MNRPSGADPPLKSRFRPQLVVPRSATSTPACAGFRSQPGVAVPPPPHAPDRRLPRLERSRTLPEILQSLIVQSETVAKGPHSGPAAFPVVRAPIKMFCRGKPRACPSKGYPRGVPLQVGWGKTAISPSWTVAPQTTPAQSILCAPPSPLPAASLKA